MSSIFKNPLVWLTTQHQRLPTDVTLSFNSCGSLDMTFPRHRTILSGSCSIKGGGRSLRYASVFAVAEARTAFPLFPTTTHFKEVVPKSRPRIQSSSSGGVGSTSDDFSTAGLPQGQDILREYIGSRARWEQAQK